MVTMKDVAKAAGVSQASVSYAYSGSPRVSTTQREQIFAVAAELGYAGPNISGSSLRLGRIGTVGVLVPGSLASAVDDPSTALLLKGIVEVGELADVALTLLPVAPTGAASEGARPATPAVLRGLVDGVVMHCLPNEHSVVRAVQSRRIPAVAIDSPRLPDIPYVTVDHLSAGAAQMEHVLALGHRRIGVIADRLGAISTTACRSLSDVDAIAETYLLERITGYRNALARHGVDESSITIIEAADIDMRSGMAAAAELFASAEPTAIVTTSDVHAAAAIKMLRREHVSVPGQVSVIGFDDAPIADLVGLTTVRQPLEDKGKTAAAILLDLLAGRSRRHVTMPTELVVRATTGAVPS